MEAGPFGRTSISGQIRELVAARFALGTPEQSGQMLFRVVRPDELETLRHTGRWSCRRGEEGKHFALSAKDAVGHAIRSVREFRDPPYTLFETFASADVLQSADALVVDGGLDCRFVREPHLGLMRPIEHASMPLI